MQFALFYEIPVPQPWGPDSEYTAYKNVLAQAVAGERHGWDAFWTVEHHFLPEFSHCSNPEVLYGAVAALTERIRIGYGVRLMPQPYNHPVRTAESVAVLDLLSDGRVDLGTGRSSHPQSWRGSGSTPPRHEPCGRRPSATWWGAGPTRSTSSTASTGRCRSDGSNPSPARAPTRPSGGLRQRGRAPPGRLARPGPVLVRRRGVTREVKAKVDIYRQAVANCTSPIGAFVNNQAATFTMALCDRDRAAAHDAARESFEWYPKTGARHIASMTDWMIERQQDLGSYAYAADMKRIDDEGALDLLSLEYLVEANACVLGTPEDCIETVELYEEAGIDLLLCLVNPYKISHEAVMQTIELMGTEVIPHFRH